MGKKGFPKGNLGAYFRQAFRPAVCSCGITVKNCYGKGAHERWHRRRGEDFHWVYDPSRHFLEEALRVIDEEFDE